MKLTTSLFVFIFIFFFVAASMALDNEEKKSAKNSDYKELIEKILDDSNSDLSEIVSDDCKIIIINSEGEEVREVPMEEGLDICDRSQKMPAIRNCVFITEIHSVCYYLLEEEK